MRALVIAIALLVCTKAHAHQTSVKYIDITVLHAHRLRVTVKFAPGDVTEALGLPPDAKPEQATVLTDKRVPPFVVGWFDIVGCTPENVQLSPDGSSFVAASYDATCVTSTRTLTLTFIKFFALDKRHEAIVRRTSSGAAPVQTIVRAQDPLLTLREGERPSLLAWIHTGMDHIYSGLDHILFVCSLLLVVMLSREGADWHTRGFALTLRSTAMVITAFTIAHSITLIAAALGVVALPSRVVETLIAVSIVYTAGEDIAKPDVKWRFALTFGFGLIHGLGFAATLAELLPPTDVVIPLLCFNVGVEIGQLTILALVLPALWLLARRIGAQRYRRYVLPVLAAPIIVVGISMVVDRVS